MIDIKQIIIQQVTDGISEKLAKSLNLPETQVKKGISIVIPYLLSALTKSGNTENILNKVENSTIKTNLDDTSNTSSLQELGVSLLDQFLSDQKDEIINQVSSSTQLEKSTASSLTSLVLPTVLDAIVKEKNSKGINLTDVTKMIDNVDQQLLIKDIGTKILDKDGDGNIADDLFDLGKKLFK